MLERAKIMVNGHPRNGKATHPDPFWPVTKAAGARWLFRGRQG